MPRKLKPPSPDEIDALNEVLESDGQVLTGIGTKLMREVAALVQTTARPVKRTQERIIRQLNQHITDDENSLDPTLSSLLRQLQLWQDESEMLLQNMAVKGGMIDPGDPLAAALLDETARAPELNTLGNLVLSISAAEPWLERLVTVLEEIRDRLPGAPTEVDQVAMMEQMEKLASDLPEDTELPIDWPEV